MEIRRLAEAIGQMVSSIPAVEFGPPFYRRCDNFKTSLLKVPAGDYDARLALPGGSRPCVVGNGYSNSLCLHQEKESRVGSDSICL